MRKRIVLLVLIILNLGTIFLFSHQTSSSSAVVSNAVSHQIEIRTPNYEQKTQNDKNIFHANMQSVVRKIAHIVLFSALGGLVLLFCATFPVRWYIAVLFTLIFGFVCALGDEIHQSFIPGRTAQWSDVVADMTGILLGIAVGLFGLLIGNIITKAIKKR